MRARTLTLLAAAALAPPALATPPATPPTTATSTAPASSTTAPAKDDLESLRAEYDALRDELFRARARLGLVGEAVFKTRLVVDVEYRAQRDWPLDQLRVKVDDVQVFGGAKPAAAKSLRAFEGFAAPGRHVIAVAIDSGVAGARAGYAASGTFAVDLAEGRETTVRVIADEVGDGPTPLMKKREGRYDVRLRANVRSAALEHK
jgi:hypothetical protein